ncbi:MAG: hypothetical protein IPP07_31740 [Holophagales bacterium]|jgi:hypothetical protein|nr:hypothetical protein [Holophagales bacterium]
MGLSSQPSRPSRPAGAEARFFSGKAREKTTARARAWFRWSIPFGDVAFFRRFAKMSSVKDAEETVTAEEAALHGHRWRARNI